MSTPSDERTTNPALFTKPDKYAYLLLICAFILNILPWISFGRPYSVWFDTVLGSILIVIFIGYKYGKKFGIIAGSTTFFPNLILYIIGYISLHQSFKGNEFAGSLVLTPYLTSRTLLIGYFLHAILGYVSAFVREKIEHLKERKEYITITKDIVSKNISSLIILAFFLAFNVDLGILRISPSKLYYLIPLYVSFYYGFRQGLCIALFLFFLSQISYRIGPISFGYGIYYPEALVFLAALYIAGKVRVYKAEASHWLSKAGFFVLFVLICFLSNLDITLSRDVNFNFAGFALAMVVLSGFMYGPRSGFTFGIVWGLLNVITIYLLKGVALSAPSIYLISAPIIGYFSGVEILDNKSFLQRGLSFILIFYAVALLVYSVFGYILKYPSVIIDALQSSIALIIMHYTFISSSSRFNTPDIRRERFLIDDRFSGATGAVRSPISRIGALVITALYWFLSGVMGFSVWSASYDHEALSIAIVGAISGMVFGAIFVVLSKLMEHSPRWNKAILLPIGLGAICAIGWYIAGIYYGDIGEEMGSMIAALGSAIISGVLVFQLIPSS